MILVLGLKCDCTWCRGTPFALNADRHNWERESEFNNALQRSMAFSIYLRNCRRSVPGLWLSAVLFKRSVSAISRIPQQVGLTLKFLGYVLMIAISFSISFQFAIMSESQSGLQISDVSTFSKVRKRLQ